MVQSAELEAIESLVARMRLEYQTQGSQGSGAGSAGPATENGSSQAQSEGGQAEPSAMAVAGAP